MMKEFEKLLATQCAPTFLGLKAASLVAIQKKKFGSPAARVAEYAQCFAGNGISVYFLADCGDYTLVLFYRENVLRRALQRRKARILLEHFGYRTSDSPHMMLARLSRRIQMSATFPHEIGLFLGYPPDDVRGFIENKGRSFICCGVWKVYADESSARAAFSRYAECTREFCRRLTAGVPMAKLLQAV